MPLRAASAGIRRLIELQLGRRVELRAEDVAVGVVRELEHEALPDSSESTSVHGLMVAGSYKKTSAGGSVNFCSCRSAMYAFTPAAKLVEHLRRSLILRVRRRRTRSATPPAGLREVVRAHLDVAVDERRRHVAEQLRQRARRGVARQVHLHHAVLRRHVALRERDVGLVVAVDVRDAPLVAHDVDGAGERRVFNDVGLRNVVDGVAGAAEKE